MTTLNEGDTVYKCDRCNGTGKIPNYKHVERGVCFKCNGTGLMHDKSKNKDDKPMKVERKKRK